MSHVALSFVGSPCFVGWAYFVMIWFQLHRVSGLSCVLTHAGAGRRVILSHPLNGLDPQTHSVGVRRFGVQIEAPSMARPESDSFAPAGKGCVRPEEPLMVVLSVARSTLRLNSHDRREVRSHRQGKGASLSW